MKTRTLFIVGILLLAFVGFAQAANPWWYGKVEYTDTTAYTNKAFNVSYSSSATGAMDGASQAWFNTFTTSITASVKVSVTTYTVTYDMSLSTMNTLGEVAAVWTSSTGWTVTLYDGALAADASTSLTEVITNTGTYACLNTTVSPTLADVKYISHKIAATASKRIYVDVATGNATFGSGTANFEILDTNSAPVFTQQVLTTAIGTTPANHTMYYRAGINEDVYIHIKSSARAITAGVVNYKYYIGK